MGINNIVFGFIISVCIACTCNASANTATAVRQRVANIYTSQIGVKEATGNNDGVQIKAYLKVTGLKEGYPWCAAFVAWCYNMAGVDAIKSAYSPNWFVKLKLTTKPKQGDLIGIYFANLKRIAHVGFYHQDAGEFVISVEGNTNDEGSREGNVVAKKRRLKRQIRCYSNWID